MESESGKHLLRDRLERKHLWNAIFRSLGRCSVGFYKSGFWLNHSRTDRLFQFCLGCTLWGIVILQGEQLPQSKVKCTLELVFFKDRYFCVWLHPFFPQFCPVALSLPLRRLLLKAQCCHQNSEILAMSWAEPALQQTQYLEFCPKGSVFVSSD